jgi:hypothetical protein
MVEFLLGAAAGMVVGAIGIAILCEEYIIPRERADERDTVRRDMELSAIKAGVGRYVLVGDQQKFASFQWIVPSVTEDKEPPNE